MCRLSALIEYVVAHEVGHTLGFQHNMKASSTYTIAQIRDPEWVKKMGHTPSIMDYSRFNYVAQPEDKIAVEDLIPKIGPYDIWATKWGYAPIPSAKSADEERALLKVPDGFEIQLVAAEDVPNGIGKFVPLAFTKFCNPAQSGNEYGFDGFTPGVKSFTVTSNENAKSSLFPKIVPSG